MRRWPLKLAPEVLAAVCGVFLALWLSWWMICVLLIILGVAEAVRVLRYQRRITQNRCVICGYDLRATPERCPECGTAVTPRREVA